MAWSFAARLWRVECCKWTVVLFEDCVLETNLGRLAESIVCRVRFLFKGLVGFGGVRCIQRRLPTENQSRQRWQGKNVVTYEPIRVLLTIVTYRFYALFQG